jgi:hypothetical protein
MTGTPIYSSPQWRQLNHHSKYPFADTSSLQSAEGFSLPLSTIIDAGVYLPGGTGRISLLSVSVESSSVVIRVGKYTDPSIFASARIDAAATQRLATLRTPTGQLAGTLLAGDNFWAELLSLAVGEYTFPPGSADFVPSVLTAIPTTVDRLLGPEGERLGSIARIVGRDGVFLDCDNRSDRLTVIVHAVGDPLSELAKCGVDANVANQVIENVVFQSGETIIECSPGLNGQILILPATFDKPDAALRVSVDPSGLRFSLAGKTLI